MPPIIDARTVSKVFRQRQSTGGFSGALRGFFAPVTKEVRAVEEISFAIEAGEAVGYLGPNGAGKSTMIKMMTGILAPSSGSLSVLGRRPIEERIANAREIGVVFGQRSQLWWDLPLNDSFDLARHIYRLPEAQFKASRAEMVAMLSLESFIDRPVRQLSLGQRMRAEIAMALLHAPKILFLDEPTIGLDVVAKDVVRKFLARINRERATTIILTTHDLQDIEEICPRLIMVDDGRLLFDGPLPALRTTFGARRRLTLDFSADPGELILDGARPLPSEGLRRDFEIADDERSLIDLIRALPAGAPLSDARLHEPGIEEVIRTHYQGRSA
ncbi:ABC transporter ATP-binding protein [Rhizobium rhizosphaerae]|uniref:ABC transporter ATP-binding protein n=1 Tax=Xaviernesmea rhizosphaerae TaxID=1672749 RepID=A0A1Q9AL89_9HYPH|nr:ATP-binding cassette domain-containing protein [Xaviernesmea rhizosphaerae]OLP56072.1 ABC transporter ATP-binding protein [Xaviernesmea rhizosphaerae]